MLDKKEVSDIKNMDNTPSSSWRRFNLFQPRAANTLMAENTNRDRFNIYVISELCPRDALLYRMKGYISFKKTMAGRTLGARLIKIAGTSLLDQPNY